MRAGKTSWNILEGCLMLARDRVILLLAVYIYLLCLCQARLHSTEIQEDSIRLQGFVLKYFCFDMVPGKSTKAPSLVPEVFRRSCRTFQRCF